MAAMTDIRKKQLAIACNAYLVVSVAYGIVREMPVWQSVAWFCALIAAFLLLGWAICKLRNHLSR